MVSDQRAPRPQQPFQSVAIECHSTGYNVTVDYGKNPRIHKGQKVTLSGIHEHSFTNQNDFCAFFLDISKAHENADGPETPENPYTGSR